MTKEVSNIVQTLVSQIDNTTEGVYNASEDRTYICDTKWMRVGKIVTDSSDNKFRITELVDDSYIVTKPLDESSKHWISAELRPELCRYPVQLWMV